MPQAENIAKALLLRPKFTAGYRRRVQGMRLCVLSTGDNVDRANKIIIVKFGQQRKVLSTSVLNGGYREDLTAVFNHEFTTDNYDGIEVCRMRAPTYEEHLRLEAEAMGLDPDAVSGMGTAALMDNAAVVVENYQTLTVTAIVTAGIEVNGGRVGDPASYYQPDERITLYKPGTINIILVIDADMPDGTMARALVTCTEAKAAALQEMMVGSNYSNGLATGSGTDETMVVANPASALYQVSAGKHSKLGELIGNAVKTAVKESLRRQAGLSPQRQHSVLRRLKRFGVDGEMLWRIYEAVGGRPTTRQQFFLHLQLLDGDNVLVTYTSLYVHLLDQFLWRLLSGPEVRQVGNELINLVAGEFGVSSAAIVGPDLNDYLQAWALLIINIAAKKLVRPPNKK